MHEIYLVKNIFDRIQEEFPEKYEDVSSVHLKVGLLSNVQPILIQNAYKAYVMECPEFYHTELVVDVLPVLIKCEECGEVTEVKQNKFVCGNCGYPTRNIVQGEELYINEINFRKNE
jgi:hydrogenase expression/synthesis hypA